MRRSASSTFIRLSASLTSGQQHIRCLMLQLVRVAYGAHPASALIRSYWRPPRCTRLTQWPPQVHSERSYATSKIPSARKVTGDVQPVTRPNHPLAYKKNEARSIAPKLVPRTDTASPPRQLAQSFTGTKGSSSETFLAGKGIHKAIRPVWFDVMLVSTTYTFV